MDRVPIEQRFEKILLLLSPSQKDKTNSSELAKSIDFLMENCFFEDSIFTNYVIHSSTMKKFSLEILEQWFIKLYTIHDDLEIKFMSFLKVVMTKTNFIFLNDFLTMTYSFISNKHSDPLFSEIGFHKLLNILQILSNLNSIVPKSSNIIMSGIEQTGLTVDFDKNFEAHNLFLNKNFCILLHFTVELHSLSHFEEPVYLFNFKVENPETGYGVYILHNKLYFYYKLPTKAPNSLNEFVIFEDLSMLVTNKWNHFSFSCQFDSLNMSSNLTITLNYQKFTMKNDFGNFISGAYQHKLHFFQKMPSNISTIMILNRPLSEIEFVKIQGPLHQHGILNNNSYEAFNQLFSPAMQKTDIMCLWNCLGTQIIEQDNFILLDCQNEIKITLPNDCLIISSCPTDFSAILIKNNFSQIISLLFSFVKTKESLGKILKISRSMIENKIYCDFALITKTPNPFKLLLSGVICTEAISLIDETNFQHFIFNFAEQSDKTLKTCVNKYLFNFHFLSRVLKNEQIVKLFFATINKSISDNFNLIHHFDMNNLMDNAIIFLSQSDRLNILKGVHLLKLLACSMTILLCVNKFDVSRPLLFLSKTEESDFIVKIIILKIIKEYIKQKILDSFQTKQFYSSISNLIITTNDAAVLKKCIKLVLLVDPTNEKFLVYSFRCKYHNKNCLDKTKKIFFDYLKNKIVIQKSELLLNYLIRVAFVDINKQNAFSNDSMVLSQDGLINLLFEVSLLMEVSLIEKVLQIMYVSMRKYEGDFTAKTEKKHLLVWILALMYKYYKSPESESIFDMGKKILIIYAMNCIKTYSNVDFFNQIAEIVHFASLETQKEEIKYLIFAEIIHEINLLDSLIIDEVALNEFILCVFKYYYINLANDKLEDFEGLIFDPILVFLQNNVNMNPALNFVPLILNSLDKNSITKSPLSKSFLANRFSMFAKSKEAHKAELCTLKLITIFTLDLLTQMFEKAEFQLSRQGSLEFISAFAYRFLNYLENHRTKILPEQAYTIEVCLYYLYRFVVKYENLIKNFDDIMKSVYFFADESIYKQSFGKKLITAMVGFSNFSRRFGEIDLKKKSIQLNEYKDADFEENFEGFVIDSIGKVNLQLENQQSTYDAYFSSDDVEILSEHTSSGMIKFKLKVDQYVSFVSYQKKIKLQSLFALFRENLYSQFEKKGLLYVEIEKKDKNLVFAPKEYEVPEKSEIISKLNNYTTSERKRPFICSFQKQTWPIPIFIDHFSLNNCFSFENYFQNLNLPFFRCNQIIDFSLIPSITCIDPVKNKLRIYIDYTKKGIIENGLLKPFSFKNYQKLVFSLSTNELKSARIYKFLRKKTACCITKINRQEIILNFENTENVNKFIEEISKMICLKNQKPYNGKESFYSLKSLVDRWKNRSISNLQFLLKLNSFGSRSYQDFSQYPIFPLVVKEFTQKVVLRDLEKPIGMAGDSKRINSILSRFNSTKSFEDIPPFHYGSHYSNPTTVFNYLIRLSPFDKGCKLIHNGAFDLPDRLFFSISNMLKNISEENCDLRELIPEFFTCPEIFLNLNNFDFGFNHIGNRVHNVEMPVVCKENPYYFVFYMAQILESANVSSKLHSWIDLIFGSKQLGEEAKKANNVFYHLTYEEIEPKGQLHKESSSNVKESDEKLETVATQVYHFGQTPFQLFDQPFRAQDQAILQETLSSSTSKLKYFIRLRGNEKLENNKLLYFKKVRRTGSQKDQELNTFVVIYESCVEIWRMNDSLLMYHGKNPFNLLLESTYKMNIINDQLASLGQLSMYKDVIEVFMFNRIIYGGMANGSIAIFVFNYGTLLNKQTIHDYPVTNLLLTPKEYLISSDSKGIIKISKLDLSSNLLTVENTIFDFFNANISSLKMASNDKQLFSFQTKESIELRSTDFASKSLFSIAKSRINVDNSDEIKDVVFSMGYIGVAVVHVYKAQKNHLFVFNFRGEMISDYCDGSEVEDSFKFIEIIRDEFFKDCLSCVTSKGDVLFLDLPFFESRKQYKSYQNINVLKITVMNKRKTMLLMDDQKCVDIISVNDQKEVIGNLKTV